MNVCVGSTAQHSTAKQSSEVAGREAERTDCCCSVAQLTDLLQEAQNFASDVRVITEGTSWAPDSATVEK